MKSRMKKVRGRKRRDPKPLEKVQQGASRQPEKNVVKIAPGKRNGAKHMPAPVQIKARPAEGRHEVERWISLIREGEFDRKVKVMGKTGPLLVRS